MPSYTIRIQLTGSPDQDIYDDLHTRMETGGFERTVTGGKTVNLSTRNLLWLIVKGRQAGAGLGKTAGQGSMGQKHHLCSADDHLGVG